MKRNTTSMPQRFGGDWMNRSLRRTRASEFRRERVNRRQDFPPIHQW